MDIKQQAIDKLANSMRRYVEDNLQFWKLIQVDKEEAVNNLDRAFEDKLETFHSLYDVTKSDFDYFKHGDTALLIVLRNAIHHRNHNLFYSLHKRVLTDGAEPHRGVSYLFVNNRICNRVPKMGFYYRLEDILHRLDKDLESPNLENKMSDKNRAEVLEVILNTLQINEIIKYAESQEHPVDRIYINFIPIFTSAVAKVFTALKLKGIEFVGFDSSVYEKPFTSELSVDYSHRDYEIGGIS